MGCAWGEGAGISDIFTKNSNKKKWGMGGRGGGGGLE